MRLVSRGGHAFNLLAYLTLGYPQFIVHLQAQPKLRAIPKIFGESQGGIRCNASFSLKDAVNMDITGNLVLANA